MRVPDSCETCAWWMSADEQKTPLLLFWENAGLYQCDFFFPKPSPATINTDGTSGRCLSPFHLCYMSTSLYISAGWTIIFPGDSKGISSLPGFRLLILGETIPRANTNIRFLVVLIQKRDSCSHWVKGYLTVLCWRTRARTKPLLVFCYLFIAFSEPRALNFL